MNMYEAQKSYLKAMKVNNIEQLLPDPRGPNAIKPGPSEKIQIEQMKMQAKQAQMQIDLKLSVAKLLQQAELQQAKIHKLEAEAILAVEQAGGVRTGHDIAMLDAQIGAARAKQEGIQDSIKTVMALEKHMSDMSSPQAEPNQGGDVSKE
jgi:hypothetical protein